MTATAEAKIEAAQSFPVEMSRLSQAEFARVQFVLNLPADYDYAELFNSDNWKAVARSGKLKMGDTIEVRKDDLSLWALLLVRESIEKHARIVVAEIFKKDFAPIAAAESNDEQFEIKHLGLQDQWAVFNRSTGRAMVKNLKSQDAARDYVNGLRPRKIGT